MFDYRDPTIRAIDAWRMTPTMIARACGLPSQRVSDYTRKVAVPTTMETRIEKTVGDIARIWEAFRPFRVDLGTPELLANGLQIAQEIELNREIHAAQKEVETMLSAL